jgi:hypothetical protein
MANEMATDFLAKVKEVIPGITRRDEAYVMQIAYWEFARILERELDKIRAKQSKEEKE